MSCSNCFNGCAEIVSDKCVRYTGIDIPQFGISNGDTLSFVEDVIITYLQSALDGTGIILNIEPSVICDLVAGYLDVPEEITALDLFTALIKATCDLQTQIDVIAAQVLDIEADYTVECLDGVVADSGTHDILQATITKLCEVDAALVALALDLDTNYVKLADLNDLIQAYLDSVSPTTQQSAKMVPYTVVEYYGPLSNFDAGGAGLASLGWDKIYLCNGSNGTPDKRGRVGVGAIAGVPGGALSPAVDPAIAGNPNYSLNAVAGVNIVTLTTPQIPAHTHLNTVTVTDPGHIHTYTTVAGVDYQRGTTGTAFLDFAKLANTSSTVTGIGVQVTNQNSGGGQSHTNIQPVWATYYIIYLP
jgi:hypothetical protein